MHVTSIFCYINCVTRTTTIHSCRNTLPSYVLITAGLHAVYSYVPQKITTLLTLGIATNNLLREGVEPSGM